MLHIVPSKPRSCNTNDCFENCIYLKIPEIVKNDFLINRFSSETFPNISQIIIPGTVQKLGDKCFANFNVLEEIFLPSSIISIGKFSFANCFSLKKIEINGFIDEIQIGCFIRCRSLQNISLKDSIEKIAKNAFKETSLVEFKIPSNVHSIGESACLKK